MELREFVGERRLVWLKRNVAEGYSETPEDRATQRSIFKRQAAYNGWLPDDQATYDMFFPSNQKRAAEILGELGNPEDSVIAIEIGHWNPQNPNERDKHNQARIIVVEDGNVTESPIFLLARSGEEMTTDAELRRASDVIRDYLHPGLTGIRAQVPIYKIDKVTLYGGSVVSEANGLTFVEAMADIDIRSRLSDKKIADWMLWDEVVVPAIKKPLNHGYKANMIFSFARYVERNLHYGRYQNEEQQKLALAAMRNVHRMLIKNGKRENQMELINTKKIEWIDPPKEFLISWISSPEEAIFLDPECVRSLVKQEDETNQIGGRVKVKKILLGLRLKDDKATRIIGRDKYDK